MTEWELQSQLNRLTNDLARVSSTLDGMSSKIDRMASDVDSLRWKSQRSDDWIPLALMVVPAAVIFGVWLPLLSLR